MSDPFSSFDLSINESHFMNEWPSQYHLYSKLPNVPHASMDQAKHFIAQLLWPRLVIVRIRQVFVTLIPLIHLDTFQFFLNQTAYALISLGWALHGLRLFINAVQLLQQLIPGVWMSDTEKKLDWWVRLQTQLSQSKTQIGNDLIWCGSALAPATFNFTILFLCIDLVWVVYRSGVELDRLSHLRLNQHDEHIQQQIGTLIAYEQKKLILNSLYVISISSMGIIKNFLMPALLPILATNPIFLLLLTSLVLSITVTDHVLNQWLEHQKPKLPAQELSLSHISLFKTGPTFFKPAAETNTTHTALTLSMNV